MKRKKFGPVPPAGEARRRRRAAIRAFLAQERAKGRQKAAKGRRTRTVAEVAAKRDAGEKTGKGQKK